MMPVFPMFKDCPLQTAVSFPAFAIGNGLTVKYILSVVLHTPLEVFRTYHPESVGVLVICEVVKFEEVLLSFQV